MRPGEEFRQGFIETLPIASRRENKYQFPLPVLKGRGESMGWARRWLRRSARPLVVPRGDHHSNPAFALQWLRRGIWVWYFFALLFIICANYRMFALILSPFLCICCFRRRFSKCKHFSKESSRCLPISSDPFWVNYWIMWDLR